jgi:predicted PurR-regulated permease PerM
MDLFTIIIIIVFIFIIKYLIDTINSLSKEIREIKEKCIIEKNTNFEKKTNMALPINTKDIIKGITYFKNYVDEKK